MPRKKANASPVEKPNDGVNASIGTTEGGLEKEDAALITFLIQQWKNNLMKCKKCGVLCSCPLPNGVAKFRRYEKLSGEE